MTRSATVVYFIALSVWIGGLMALVFAAFQIFEHAPSTAVAGRIFGPTLRAFAYVELVCAALVLLTGLVIHFGDREGRGGAVVRLVLIGLLIVLLVLHIFAVGIPIEEERASIANFEDLDPDDPARARFNTLHRWSERLVSAEILAGLVLIGVSAATLRR